jgi:DNA-directed RNA polymerase subunit L
MSNTQVDEKDLPKVETVYVNAPETLEAAIARIMELEMRLEDLARASEIAMITRQFDMMESFKTSADECLLTKITIDHPSAEDFKLTVITDEKTDA